MIVTNIEKIKSSFVQTIKLKKLKYFSSLALSRRGLTVFRNVFYLLSSVVFNCVEPHLQNILEDV